MKAADYKSIVRYAIFVFFATLLSFWFFYQIRNILIMLFLAFILMSAIYPLVTKAQSFKIPRVLTIFSIYLLILIFFFGIIASLMPVVVNQTTGLVDRLPDLLNLLDRQYHLKIDLPFLTQNLHSVPGNLFKLVAGLFSNAFNIFAIFFLTYYLLVEHDRLHHYLFFLFSDNKKAKTFLHNLEKSIGYWANGQLLLMFIIGLATYLGLLLLKMPYALPLAMLAGLLEAVPNLGPTISAIISVLVGLTVSPLLALGALILGVIIQQLENNLVVPQVMRYAVGIPPIVTLSILLVGLELGGIIGAIVAVPAYLTVKAIYNYHQSQKGGSHVIK